MKIQDQVDLIEQGAVEGQIRRRKMNAKHTPGPWRDLGGPEVFGPKGFMICMAEGKDRAEKDANARLIAAAPDLLDALRSVLDEHRDCKGCASCSMALAAIAKAEGRE